MGFFALIASGSGSSAPTIDRCHINVWRYDGYLLPRVFCFDVGLGLITPPGEAGATKFKIALPFSCDSWADLWEPMKNPTVATLVFGRDVQFNTNKTIVSYTDKQNATVSLKLTAPKSVTRDENKSGGYYSMWDVELSSPPAANEILYLRLRFHVGNFSRSWFSHSGGELIDIRVADTRESVAIPEWNCFASEIVPTPGLRIFIIAPAELEPRTSSPSYKARALERTVWLPYTGGRAAWPFTQSQRFAIYGFGPDDGDVVGFHNPFRLYFALGGRHHPLWVKTLSLLVVGGLGVVLGQRIGVEDPWAGLMVWAHTVWTDHREGIVSSLTLATIIQMRTWLARVKLVAPWLRQVDRWILFDGHR
jgi:hypothetical protein